MPLAISIIMTCNLSVQEPPTVDHVAIATGICAGSYSRKVSQEPLGSWMLKVRVARDKDGKVTATKLGGQLMVPDFQDDQVGMKEMEDITLRFIADQVEGKKETEPLNAF